VSMETNAAACTRCSERSRAIVDEGGAVRAHTIPVTQIPLWSVRSSQFRPAGPNSGKQIRRRLPHYRKSEIFERDGIDIERSMLAEGVRTLRHFWSRWHMPTGGKYCQGRPCLQMTPWLRSWPMALVRQRRHCGPIAETNDLGAAIRP
jgi:hypothetical protein